jgi:hypothetical protein
LRNRLTIFGLNFKLTSKSGKSQCTRLNSINQHIQDGAIGQVDIGHGNFEFTVSIEKSFSLGFTSGDETINSGTSKVRLYLCNYI